MPDVRKAHLEAEFNAIDLARALRDRGLDAIACVVNEKWVVAVDARPR